MTQSRNMLVCLRCRFPVDRCHDEYFCHQCERLMPATETIWRHRLQEPNDG